mgnify:CR=1 FL=1
MRETGVDLSPQELTIPTHTHSDPDQLLEQEKKGES